VTLPKTTTNIPDHASIDGKFFLKPLEYLEYIFREFLDTQLVILSRMISYFCVDIFTLVPSLFLSRFLTIDFA